MSARPDAGVRSDPRLRRKRGLLATAQTGLSTWPSRTTSLRTDSISGCLPGHSSRCPSAKSISFAPTRACRCAMSILGCSAASRSVKICPLIDEEFLPTEKGAAVGAVDDARPDRWGERVIRFNRQTLRVCRSSSICILPETTASEPSVYRLRRMSTCHGAWVPYPHSRMRMSSRS